MEVPLSCVDPEGDNAFAENIPTAVKEVIQL
jgi:hypothetical protein